MKTNIECSSTLLKKLKTEVQANEKWRVLSLRVFVGPLTKPHDKHSGPPTTSHHFCYLVLFFLLFPCFVYAQSDCIGEVVDRKTFSFQPPLWERQAENMWENADHSAQIQLRAQDLRPEVTVEKYKKEFPEHLKESSVKISKEKVIKISDFDAFLMEGKQPIGSAFSRLKSISVFGNGTLYFFTLIANKDAYKKASACFDSVVATLKEKAK